MFAFLFILFICFVVGVAIVAHISLKNSYTFSNQNSQKQSNTSLKIFVDKLNEFTEKRDYYISIVKQNGDEYKIKRIIKNYENFDKYKNQYVMAVANKATALTGQGLALKQQKIDPFIAGGAASALGGTGLGVASALGAANHNSKVDETKNYFNNAVNESNFSEKTLRHVLVRTMRWIEQDVGIYNEAAWDFAKDW